MRQATREYSLVAFFIPARRASEGARAIAEIPSLARRAGILTPLASSRSLPRFQ